MLITMCFDLNVKHELLIKLFSSVCHNYTGMLTNLKIELLCKMLAGFVKTATFKLTLWKEWHLCYDGLAPSSVLHPETQNLCKILNMRKEAFL